MKSKVFFKGLITSVMVVLLFMCFIPTLMGCEQKEEVEEEPEVFIDLEKTQVLYIGTTITYPLSIFYGDYGYKYDYCISKNKAIVREYSKETNTNTWKISRISTFNFPDGVYWYIIEKKS